MCVCHRYKESFFIGGVLPIDGVFANSYCM